MAQKLEGIVSNFVAGTVTGIVSVVDPLGCIVSGIDYSLSGVGFSDKDRALEIYYNSAYQKSYELPKENVEFGKGYAPRLLGNIAGSGAGICGLVGLYYIGGPIAALALPGYFALHCLFGTIPRYLKEAFCGEKINNKIERATFENGFLSGYEQATHPILSLAHYFESMLTGRGLGNSHIYSSIVEPAGKSRRNIGSILGYGCGTVVGAVVSVATLGIVPLYKTIRDIIKNFKKK